MIPKSLFSLRFFFELLALPFFIFLVIHMAGHGAMLLFEGDEHNHSFEHEDEAVFVSEMEGVETLHDETHQETHDFSLLSEEGLFGLLFLLVFVWIWHRPTLHRWVPCAHEHCHTEKRLVHLLAIGAFCIHFFPEAGVRHELLDTFTTASFLSLAALFGFVSHFLVDLIVAVILASYFHKPAEQILALLLITALWILAYFSGSALFVWMSHGVESVIYLLGAFLLAMFIHLPHPPKKHCETCECEHEHEKK